MLLEKFSDIIDRSPIGAAVDYRQKLIEQTDPNRIYVENIRSFFGISHGTAKFLCDLAVKQGAFERRIGIMCPNCNTLIGDYGANDAIPRKVTCEHCAMLGESVFSFYNTECRKISFYKVIKDG